jgi:hypothetical protein
LVIGRAAIRQNSGIRAERNWTDLFERDLRRAQLDRPLRTGPGGHFAGGGGALWRGCRGGTGDCPAGKGGVSGIGAQTSWGHRPPGVMGSGNVSQLDIPLRTLRSGWTRRSLCREWWCTLELGPMWGDAVWRGMRIPSGRGRVYVPRPLETQTSGNAAGWSGERQGLLLVDSALGDQRLRMRRATRAVHPVW